MTFEPEGDDSFMFVGALNGPHILMISSLKARDLLQGGCIEFLASMVDNTRDVPVGLAETRLVY